MKKLAIAAAALMLAGCAHQPNNTQVNRTAKSDKYLVKKASPVEQPTPNQQVKKRWYDRFKIHPKWFRQ
jgi:starvation-inducible outer membrane lipoprotein